MNKCIIFVSFVLISLLAIGAVSADSNIANESFVQQASLNDEQLNVEEVGDIKEESSLTKVDDVKSDEIVSDSETKKIPIINVENTTAEEYDQPIIPFNVTDSEGNLISGEVIITVHGLDDNVTRDIVVYNGIGIDSFKKLDLDKQLENNPFSGTTTHKRTYKNTISVDNRSDKYNIDEAKEEKQ